MHIRHIDAIRNNAARAQDLADEIQAQREAILEELLTDNSAVRAAAIRMQEEISAFKTVHVNTESLKTADEVAASVILLSASLLRVTAALFGLNPHEALESVMFANDLNKALNGLEDEAA